MTRTNWFILGLAVLASGLGGYVEHRHRQPDAPFVGQTLPAISLPGLDGKTHALSDYRGHRLLLNFWASWCGPCLKEMPALNSAQARFAAGTSSQPGSVVIGIAMDDPRMARAFVAAHPLHYPILLGNLDVPSTSQQLGDVTGVLPYSVLVGADGRVLATREGSLSTDEMDQWLTPDSAP
jgi:peroxiredoxin